jgi:hypothetical protein
MKFTETIVEQKIVGFAINCQTDKVQLSRASRKWNYVEVIANQFDVVWDEC